MSETFKIEYRAIGGYTTTAYVSWLNEGETARGTHKHVDAPVYIRWSPEREEWVEEEPATVIAEYVLNRLGHCGDCAKVVAWDLGHDPAELDCDCAYRTVEGLFAELTEGQR